jgi:dimethylaniline monooxygenase (N-oxide forming)
MTVAVIGAGSSGLAACHALAARGIPYECFERGSRTGGLWRFDNDNGLPSAYRGLFPNTSRTAMQFGAHPMPEDWPDFPSHWQIARYLDDFADRFGLREHIRFGTGVERVRRAGDGWDVTLDDGTTSHHDAVMVASGAQHNAPDVPAVPGAFDGEQIHSSAYRDPGAFAGRRVLVVGLGASGADIACEVAPGAERVALAVRTGHYIVPKLIGGGPMDKVSSPLIARLPMWSRRPVYNLLMRVVQGDMTDYGLPAPPYKLGQAPLVPHLALLSSIRHGLVAARPAVQRLDGDGVVFADGTREEFDVIVWCTGFRLSLPFLDEDIAGDGSDCPPLYLRAVHPDHERLWFIALLQPFGSTFPIAEAQARWLAAVLAGEVSLPPATEMRREITRERRRMERQFHDTSRGLLVEPYSYLRRLDREWRRRGTDRPRTVSAAPVPQAEGTPA